jgi:hypothetical protein
MVGGARFSEAPTDLVSQLELQLLDMIASFVVWFNAQKSYANTMNELLKRELNMGLEQPMIGFLTFCQDA